ncbi:TPA_asm: L [Artemisia betacytorhabdovirus 1]|nr:TPA_asm: L [Artemisia betacytorhabdovirus 1]
MDLSDILSEMGGIKPLQGIGDFHLRSALQKLDIDALHRGKGRWREINSFKAIISVIPPDKIRHVQLSDLLYYITSDRVLINPPKIMCWEELMEILSIEKRGLKKMFTEDDPFSKMLMFLRSHGIENEYSAIKTQMTLGMMTCLAKNSNREVPYCEGIKNHGSYFSQQIGNATFGYFGELIIVRRKDAIWFELMSLDHLRMIIDKLTERDNVLLANEIGNKIFPQIYPRTEDIRKVFLLFDNHLRCKGNDGYKLLKTYEALVTGVILDWERTGYWDSTLFLTSTIRDLEPDDKRTANEFVDLLRTVNSVHHLTQICGLFRLWGHPLIDSKEGIKKVKTIGEKKKIINPYSVSMSRRSFLEIFYSNYFRTKGKYPNCTLGEKEGDYLLKCLHEQAPFSVNNHLYDFSSWDLVDTEKTFDIPETFNLSMIVADTAISPTRKELVEAYESGKPAMEATTRRGVLKWMKDGMIDCGTLLKNINDHPTGLPKNHCAIGLYPKEREMNPVARMFALTTLLMRSYIVVTESMLSENILQYIPGITMTHSLLQLTKEMVRVTWRQKDSSQISRTFCINMDFEKWNLNMREEATHGVFSELGKLFGLPDLYNKTYSIFKESMVYLADGSFIPPIDKDTLEPLTLSDELYLGHGGGFEGLRQKGWTIFTVVIISKICQRLNIDWKLMGQGDNQVLMVTIYSKYARRYGIDSEICKKDISSQLKKLMETLIDEFKEVGLPLKPLETWISDTFFSYGKTPLYKGVPCASSLKKISRVFFFSNEDLMTLDNALGAVGANAQSAVMGDVHPVIPYMIAKWQQIMCTRIFRRYHPLIGDSLERRITGEFVMSRTEKSTHKIPGNIDMNNIDLLMSIIPKTLGGYNTINYFRMMMRGFPDPQNMDYQWLNEFYSGIPDGHNLKEGVGNFLLILLNDTINYTYLMQDVTGLNLYVPTNSTQVVKDMIHRTIDKMDFDSEFSGWFKVVLKNSEKSVIEDLTEKLCEPEQLNVRLWHDIISSSIYGYCDSITSKIDKTVTLSRIALGQEDVVEALIRNEVRFFSYFCWRQSTSGNLSRRLDECPSKYIRDARKTGWNKDLIGVDVPFPYHFMCAEENETDRPDSYVQVILNEFGISDQDILLNQVGKALPYLGSMTKEKIASNPKQVSYGAEPLLTRPMKLLRIIGWFVAPGSNIAELIKDLVRAVSDLDPDDFAMAQDKVKGSMAHRYKDDGTKHGSLWMPLFGPATYLNLSTNNFVQFSKGSKNVTLHFQALLCYLQYISVNMMMSSSCMKSVKFYRGCKSCITDLVEEFEDLPDRIAPSLIPQEKDNPYLYITSDRIPITIKESHSFNEYLPILNLDRVYPHNMQMLLEDWLACKLAISMTSGADNSIERGLLDIGGISRTVYLKLDPVSVLKLLSGYLWVIFGRQEKYQREGVYPTWELVKGDILRTITRTPPPAFISFSGFFLWEESKSLLENYVPVVHKSYPMNASSISEISKEIVIRHMIALKEFYVSRSHIIIDGDESHVELSLKASVLRRNLSGGISECTSCTKHAQRIPINSKTSLPDLYKEKCKEGHFLVLQEDILSMYRSPGILVESMADIVSNHPFVARRLRPRSIITFIPRTDLKYLVMDNRVPLMGDLELNSKEDGEDFRILKRFTGAVTYFSAISRGMYRSGELHFIYPFEMTDDLLILGDGFGGTSLGASLFGKWNSITAWTYLDMSDGIPHSSTLSKPPLHFNYDLNIDNSPSFYEYSLIGRPEFIESFERVVSSKKITTMISDIEWWYIGSDHSELLISLASRMKIRMLFLRVFLNPPQTLRKTLSTASRCYSRWEMVFSESCSPFNNSGWLIMSRPRESNEGMYIADQSWESIKRDVQIKCDEYTHVSIDGDMTAVIDKTLIQDKNFTGHFEELIIEYFWKAEMTDFLSSNFTKLFLSLRTGRRPKDVMDMGDNRLYYDRDSQRYKVMTRLILIALSLLVDESEAASYIERRWELKWESEESNESEIRRYIRTNIQLYSDPIKQSNLHSKDKREILSFVKLLKRMRDEHSIREKETLVLYPTIGKVIKFEYCPTHLLKRRRQVFFRVSKVLSYNLT